MIIRIDGTIHTPIYEQIFNQVVFAVALGTIKPGEQLPSVRQLATDLIINPNTVARAYRELERENIISSQKGVGLFVSQAASRICSDERTRIVKKALRGSLSEAAASGIDRDKIKEMIDEELEAKESKEG
jgi:GntR family transcriptional regulator